MENLASASLNCVEVCTAVEECLEDKTWLKLGRRNRHITVRPTYMYEYNGY